MCSICAILQIFLFLNVTWYVKFNRLPCPIDKMYDDEVFADRFRFQLTTFEMCVLIGLSRPYHAHIVQELATAKITAEFPRNSLYLVWFDTVEFNHLPCPNDKMYDDEVFVDRFCYHLSMYEIILLVRLSRLLHAHIAYEIAIAKIIAETCRFSKCLAWFDVVEFNRLLSPNDKMYDDEVFAADSAIN